MTVFASYDTEADWSEVDNQKYWFPILILIALIVLYFTLKAQ